MDPVDLTWNELSDPDERGDTLLSRWAAGTLDEGQERSVNLYLLSSTWARDEASLHLAIRDGLPPLTAERSPVVEGLRIAVRATVGLLEVLQQSLRPLQPAAVRTRTGEFRRPTQHVFALDAVHAGARLHVMTRGDRFALEITHETEPTDHAEWALAGPGGSLVASDVEGPSFPSVAPGSWVLERRGEGASTPVRLELLVEG